MIGTTIVSRIPVLGPLVAMAMIVFGSGAAALAIAEWRQARGAAGARAGRHCRRAAASTAPLAARR